MKSLMITSRKDAGFTLLEMLLAVGIIGMLMVLVSKLSADFIQQKNAQAAGQQIGRISEIAEDTLLRSSPVVPGPSSNLLSKPDQRGIIGGNILQSLVINELDITDPKFMIANSPVDVAYGDNTSGAGPASGTLFIRVLVILKKPFPIAQAMKISRAIGARGGVLRYDHPTDIMSAFGNWTYPISLEVANSLSGSGVTPPKTGEAYVISYRSMAPSDVIGPYVNKYGDGGRNVMHHDLLMNGNSIVRAKDLDAGTITATKAARFDQMSVNGVAKFEGGLDANGAVNVKGSLAVAEGDMSVTNGDLKVPGGNVTAKGLRADTLEADDLTTKDLSTKTLTVDGGNTNTLITSNLTVTGGASMDITGPLRASVVDADSITTKTMKTQTMSVKDGATLAGATTITNTTSIDQLVLDGCMLLNGVAYPKGCH